LKIRNRFNVKLVSF